MNSINDGIKLLEQNDYIVLKKEGLLAPGYGPFINNWNVYQPWLNDQFLQGVVAHLIAKGVKTLVSYDRLYTLRQLLQNTFHLQGEIWEAGVYQGGTAYLFSEVLRNNNIDNTSIRLFDTFEGMPETHSDFDKHNKGDFDDTSLETVKGVVGQDHFIEYRQGLVPETFSGLETSTIKFAHIDLDIYEPILASCQFVWPRLVNGGIMAFDDYGFSTCPGAKKAVDEFFASQSIKPLVLPTGQAIITKTL